MKKLIVIILIIMTFVTMTTSVYAQLTLTDISETDWFYNNLTEMINLGMVNGYEDGTFKPQAAVKADEFIKMVIVGMGYEAKPTTSTYWADGFIQKAEELKICDTTFINDYRFDLTREQAAKIIANALSLKEMRPLDVYYNHIKPIIRDFYMVQDKYKEDVVDCYAWGIMQGDNNRLINPQKTITRAETTTAILRLIDKNRRLQVKLDGVKTLQMETSEQTQGLLVAPIYNGKVINEIVELMEKIQNNEENSLGIEKCAVSEFNQGTSASGFENQRKFDEWYDINRKAINGELTGTDLINEFNKIIHYRDWSFTINLVEMHHKRTPYDMVIYNRFSVADDTSCKSNYEYMMKYYKETFSDMFKLWFGQDYDKAWSIFEVALKANNEISKSQEIIINNRNFFIAYDSKGLSLTVSLELK